jgi:hypothetical protein
MYKSQEKYSDYQIFLDKVSPFDYKNSAVSLRGKNLAAGEKVYSQDDITLGKLVVEMDEIGIGVKDGFDAEALKHYRDMFRDIVVMSHKYYIEATLGKLSPEEFSKRIVQGREIMSAFFYHLYRKLSREKYKRILALLESGATGLEEEDS